MLLTCLSMVRSLRNNSVGDGLVGLAGGDQAKHLQLAGRQPVTIAPTLRDCASESRRARSGAAPKRSNTALAAAELESAVSSSPSERHASADQHPHACGLVRRLDLSPHLESATQWTERGRASPSASSTAPRACAAIARSTSVSNVSAISSSSRQALRASCDVARGQHDFDVGRQQLRALAAGRWPRSRRGGSRAHAASVRPWAIRSRASPGCGSHPNRPAFRYASSAAANSPRRRCSLGLLIERRGRRMPVDFLGDALTGAACLCHGVRPGAI